MIGLPEGSIEEDIHVCNGGSGVSFQLDNAGCEKERIIGRKLGKLLIVEGNIGIGKTTLCRTLAKELNYKLYLEPTVENPYLDKFYAEPKKYALKLQLWILQQRYLTYSAAVKHVLSTDMIDDGTSLLIVGLKGLLASVHPAKIAVESTSTVHDLSTKTRKLCASDKLVLYGEGAILDRSVFGDCVFANVCTKEGYISPDGYKQYQYWLQKALENLPLPHVTLFLDATPVCCYNRIHQRGRMCENGVPLDYLSKLHEEYQLFIQDMRVQGCLVLRYDWSTFKDEKMVSSDIKTAKVPLWKLEAPLKINELSIPLDREHSLEVLLDQEKE